MNYLLIGLGNSGRKYAHTRHNAGKMLAAWLKEEGKRKKEEGGEKLAEFETMETDCYMNKSGEWLAKKIQNSEFRIQNLIIAHDDLDLPLGSFKIQFGKGPYLHKGILSIEKALGTRDFWRVRIGVDNRGSNSEFRIQNSEFLRPSGEDYVLRPFKREEKIILNLTFGLIKQALWEQFTK